MNNLTGHTCYLIGAIDDAKDYGVNWRKDFSKFLNKIKVGVFDPTAKPSGFVNETKDSVEFLNKLKEEGDYGTLSKVMKKIVSIDLHYLDLSNFVVAYLDLDVRLTGSITEITYAALEKKPIIIICPQGKAKLPNWLYGMCDHRLFFDDIESSKQYINKVNNNKIFISAERWRFINYGKVFGNEVHSIL